MIVNKGIFIFTLIIFIRINLYHCILQSFNAGYSSKDTSGIVAGESTRQCECWKWPACISNCTANSILSRLFSTNHRLIEKIPRPFIVIFPYQVRRQNHKKIDTNTLNKQGHYKLETNFWIHLLNGEDLQLQLKKSSIFGDESKKPNNFYLKYYEKSRVVISNTLKKCFYTGSVLIENPPSSSLDKILKTPSSSSSSSSNRNKPIAHSHVAADTCDGLRGIILYKGVVYGIQPMKSSDTDSNVSKNRLSNDGAPVAHFIYPESSTLIERNASNLRTFWHKMPPKYLPPAKDSGRLMIIPVSVYMDYSLVRQFESDISSASYFILSLINYMTNAYTSLQKLVQIRLHSIELWNLGDKSPIDNRSIKTTLNSFLRYLLSQTNEETPSKQTDNGQELPRATLLLSGKQFVEDVEYFAIPDSICTKRALAVVQIISIKQVYHVSKLMALAIAEMFGINRFPCPNRCYSRTVLSKEDQLRLKLVLRNRQAECLLSDDSNSISKKASRITNPCGNNKLDLGEECDNSANSLGCCDTHTCLMAPYAQCNSGGCCNTNCTFLTRGRYCRPARDQCDIPEFCSGDNGQCPRDIFLENGQPCDRGSALCYEGRCPTRDSQCSKLWGSTSAKHANSHCYSTLNLKSDDACPPGTNGKCTKENRMCGILYCAGGPNNLDQSQHKELQGPSRPVFVNTYIQFNNKSVQCKYINNAQIGYVEDGSQCGPDKYCFGNTCVNVTGSIINSTKCARNISISTGSDAIKSICYNKGICTSSGVCLCHPGWSGSDCSRKINTNLSIPLSISYIDQTNPLNYSEQVKNYIWAYFKEVGIYNGPLRFQINQGNTNYKGQGLWSQINTTHVIAAIGCLVGIVFIVLITLMVCYRRRIVHRSKRGFTQYDNKHGVDSTDVTDSGGTGAAANYRYTRHQQSPKGILGRKNNQYGDSPSNAGRKTNELRYDSRKKRRRRTNPDTDNEDKKSSLDNDFQQQHNDMFDSQQQTNHSPHRDHGDCIDTSMLNNNQHYRLGSNSGIGGNGSVPTTTSATDDLLMLGGPNQTTTIPLSNQNDSLLIGGLFSSNENCQPINQANYHSAASSMDRMIKFGVMPSYKEDKIRCGSSHGGTNSSSANSASNSLQHHHHYIPPPVSNVSPQPILTTTNQNSPYHRYPPITTPTSPPAPIGLPAPALFPNVPLSHFSNSPNLPISTSASSPLHSTAVATTNSAHPLQSVSQKQPEKGILKNKGQSNEKKECNKCDKKNQSNKKKSKDEKSEHGQKKKSHNKETNNTVDSSLSSHSCGDDSSSNSSSTTSSTCSSSSSSSSSVGIASLITHAHTHHHKSSGSTNQNGGGEAAPTILCNASNQTDEDPLKHSEVAREYLIGEGQLKNNGEEEEEEEEEVEECDEEECEECMRLQQQQQQTQHPQQQEGIKNSQDEVSIINQKSNRQKSPPETLITSNSSAYDIVGSTTDENNYHQELLNNASQQPMMMMMMPPGAGMMMMMTNKNAGQQNSSENSHSGQNSETEVDSHLHQYNQYLIHHPYPPVSLVTGPNQHSHYSTVLTNQNAALTGGGGGSSSYYYPPITNHGTDLSQHLHDQDDVCSEVSISAYCRVPKDHHHPHHRNNNVPVVSQSETKNNGDGSSSNHKSSGVTGYYDGASNDGTIEGSDTSSLPDAHCDLLNLAHLGIGSTSRPNPMLSQILRANNNISSHDNSPLHHPLVNKSELNNSKLLGPSDSITSTTSSTPWSPNNRSEQNRSPGQLPNPNNIVVNNHQSSNNSIGMDFSA